MTPPPPPLLNAASQTAGTGLGSWQVLTRLLSSFSPPQAGLFQVVVGDEHS